MGLVANSPRTWWARSGVTAWDFLETVTGWLSFRGKFITFLSNKNFSSSGENISEYHEGSNTFITRCCMHIAHSTLNSLDYFWVLSSIKFIDRPECGRVQTTPLGCSYSLSCLCFCSLLHFWLHDRPVSRQGSWRGWLLRFLPLPPKPTSHPALHQGTGHNRKLCYLQPMAVSKATTAGSESPLCEEAELQTWNKHSRPGRSKNLDSPAPVQPFLWASSSVPMGEALPGGSTSQGVCLPV